MEALQQLEIYITAQKNVAIQFIIIGVVLIVLAVLLYLFGKETLSNGLKIGALICGCFILIGGIAYLNTENKLLKTQTELYQKSPTEFQQIETERMQKVTKDYLVYQIAFGSLIVLSLLVVWFVKNQYWHGIAFSVMLLFVAVMIVEAYSHSSIKAYFEFLTR